MEVELCIQHARQPDEAVIAECQTHAGQQQLKALFAHACTQAGLSDELAQLLAYRGCSAKVLHTHGRTTGQLVLYARLYPVFEPDELAIHVPIVPPANDTPCSSSSYPPGNQLEWFAAQQRSRSRSPRQRRRRNDATPTNTARRRINFNSEQAQLSPSFQLRRDPLKTNWRH